jgi:hypothetical protein
MVESLKTLVTNCESGEIRRWYCVAPAGVFHMKINVVGCWVEFWPGEMSEGEEITTPLPVAKLHTGDDHGLLPAALLALTLQ